MLNYMFEERIEFDRYSNDQKMEIFSLNFTTLVAHEVTHTILRTNVDDFIVSSPTIYQNDKLKR